MKLTSQKEYAHVFYVHSNITLLAALGVIDKLLLSNVVFLLGRNFTTNLITEKYRTIQLDNAINSLSNVPTNGTKFLIFKHLFGLQLLDSILRSVGKNGFVCYLPSTKNFLMQAIITSKFCKEYNIIEEGLLSYVYPQKVFKQSNSYYTSTLKGKIKSFLKFPYYLGRSIYYKNVNAKTGNIFMFFEDELNKNENKLNYQFISMPKSIIETVDYSNATFFLFDNTVGDNVTDIETNLKILSTAFSQINNENLFIKFHPAQKDNDNIIRMLKFMNIPFNTIPLETPMELIFLTSQNLKVYGLFSSLLFYAALAGHESYSFLRIAEEYDKNISLWIKNEISEQFFIKVKIL